MNRIVRLATVLSGLGLSLGVAAQAPAPVIDVHKSPTCGCCSKWIGHLERSGFAVRTHETTDPGAMRRKLAMPDRYAACHTATIGGYAIEGHVPAADIRRLLAERPSAIGIAVPSMPPGSPGMESPRTIPYDTLLVGADGSATVFARH